MIKAIGERITKATNSNVMSIAEIKKEEILNQIEFYKKTLCDLGTKPELTNAEKLTQARAKGYIAKWTEKAIDAATKKLSIPPKKVLNRSSYVLHESSPEVQEEMTTLPPGIKSALKKASSEKKKMLTFGNLEVREFDKDGSTDVLGDTVTIKI